MSLRIAFASAGGTGKTTLLPYVSSALNVEIKNVTTMSLMDKYNLSSQNDAVLVASAVPNIGIKFQSDLINTRYNTFYIESNVKDQDFVTDRTPLDSLAYYMIHNSYWDKNENSKDLIDIVTKSSELYDYVFMLPTNVIPVEDDGRRGLNPEYHELVQNTIRYLAKRTGYNLIEVPEDVVSLEDRTNWVKTYIINDKLKSILRKGVLNIKFLKKDGSERLMSASLERELIESVSPEFSESKSTRKSNINTISVIDTAINEWRSFNISSIIGIEFNGEWLAPEIQNIEKILYNA